MIGSTFGAIVQKKEMTSILHEGKIVPITLLFLVSQDVVRYKTVEKDGYNAVVLGANKKVYTHKKGTVRTVYQHEVECGYDDDFQSNLDNASLNSSYASARLSQGLVSIVGYSKGKGFAGVVKRYNVDGGPETHGSKFHKHIGSLGCRKPRRVQKGHIHAGRMGGDRITLKGRKVLGTHTYEGKEYIIVQGSLPGAYNSYMYVGI